jgi:hypothetical protein
LGSEECIVIDDALWSSLSPFRSGSGSATNRTCRQVGPLWLCLAEERSRLVDGTTSRDTTGRYGYVSRPFAGATIFVVPDIYEFKRRGSDPAYPESALGDWQTLGRRFCDRALLR